MITTFLKLTEEDKYASVELSDGSVLTVNADGLVCFSASSGTPFVQVNLYHLLAEKEEV